MRLNKEQSEKKRRVRLPIHVYLGYILIAMLIFTGVTFSKYVASSSGGDSARVANFGDLKLYELGKDNKPLPEGAVHNFTVTPGVNIYKDPVVDFNTEGNSEVAAYIFVTISAPGWSFVQSDTAGCTYSVSRTADGTALMQWSVSPTWKYFKADNGSQIFYTVAAPGEKLSAVDIMAPLSMDDNNTIRVSPALYASEMSMMSDTAKSITFQAYAVQKLGFPSTDDAWNAIKDK